MDFQKVRGALPGALTLAGIIAIVAFLYFYGNFLLALIFEQFFDKRPLEAFFPAIFKTAELIIGTAIFLVISKFAFSKYLEINRKKKEAKIILKLYTYLVWGLVLILIIMSFFEDVGALLTSLGLIGFGITFALQKPILNFVGWLTIILTNPFTVGDRIEVSQIRGDVLSINTMYTRMQGTRATSQEKSEKIITLPNEFILTNPVINYSRLGDLFTDELAISITFESNWRKAMEILENVVLTTIANYRKDVPITKAEKKAWHEAIKLLQEASKKIKSGFVKESVKENIDMLKTTETKPSPEIPKPQFQLVLGESALNLSVIYQTDLRSVRQTKHEIVKGFLEEIEKWHDIEIAYPHMQIVTQGKTRGIKKTGKNILTFMEAENQQPI